MVAPVVPIAMMVLGAVRLATPVVAKALTRLGFKKAAKGATKNASNITNAEVKKLAINRSKDIIKKTKKTPLKLSRPKKPSVGDRIKTEAKAVVQDIKKDLKASDPPGLKRELIMFGGGAGIGAASKVVDAFSEKKASGGTVKNYAHGGSVRKAKFIDS